MQTQNILILRKLFKKKHTTLLHCHLRFKDGVGGGINLTPFHFNDKLNF